MNVASLFLKPNEGMLLQASFVTVIEDGNMHKIYLKESQHQHFSALVVVFISCKQLYNLLKAIPVQNSD